MKNLDLIKNVKELQKNDVKNNKIFDKTKNLEFQQNNNSRFFKLI